MKCFEVSDVAREDLSRLTWLCTLVACAVGCSGSSLGGSCEMGFSTQVSPKILGGMVHFTPNQIGLTTPVDENLKEPPLPREGVSCTFIAEPTADFNIMHIVTSRHCFRFSESFIKRANFHFFLPEGESGGYFDPLSLETKGMAAARLLSAKLAELAPSASSQQQRRMMASLMQPPGQGVALEKTCSEFGPRGSDTSRGPSFYDAPNTTDACFSANDLAILTIDLSSQSNKSAVASLKSTLDSLNVRGFNTSHSRNHFEKLISGRNAVADSFAKQWVHYEQITCIADSEYETKIAGIRANNQGISEEDLERWRGVRKQTQEIAGPWCSVIAQKANNTRAEISQILSSSGNRKLIDELAADYWLERAINSPSAVPARPIDIPAFKHTLEYFSPRRNSASQGERAQPPVDKSNPDQASQENPVPTVIDILRNKTFIVYGLPALRSQGATTGAEVFAPIRLIRVEGSDFDTILGSMSGFTFSSNKWPITPGARDSGTIMLTTDGFIIGTLAAVDGTRSSGGAAVIPLPRFREQTGGTAGEGSLSQSQAGGERVRGESTLAEAPSNDVEMPVGRRQSAPIDLESVDIAPAEKLGRVSPEPSQGQHSGPAGAPSSQGGAELPRNIVYEPNDEC